MLNAKQVNFTHELKLDNRVTHGGFDVLLRRCSTTQKFFELLNNQMPNQLLYNLEEQECYFLNEDCDLFRLKFEPIIMKKKNKANYVRVEGYENHTVPNKIPYTSVEEYLKNLKQGSLKEEIKKLAIPWNKFHNKNYNSYICSNFSLIEITNLFIGLLDLIKKKQIKVRCGIAMMHLLTFLPVYYSTKFGDKLELGTCEVNLELDFELAKYDLMYDDILLVGESIVEQEPKEVKIEKPRKKFLGLF
jgi:hypothetical protein